MRKYQLLIIVFVLFGIVLYGQNYIDFDNPNAWVAGSGGIGSYQNDHLYQDGIFSVTGGPALREAAGTQDGFPKTYGTYAWRLKDDLTVNWVINIASGGVNDFTIKIRRWDDSPSPDYNLEYSTDGQSWNFVAQINNASLGNSSNWTVFAGDINSAADNIKIRIKANRKGERIMVDDFVWNAYQDLGEATLAISPGELELFAYTAGFGASEAQSFTVAGENLSAPLDIDAGAYFELAFSETGAFSGQIQLPISGHTLEITNLYLRMQAGLSPGTYSQNISFSSGNLFENYAVQGRVVEAVIPDAPVALEASELSATEFVANWEAAANATNYRVDLYQRISANAAEDLFFSEYVEGSSFNKALEIFNGTGNTVNLADYQVQLYSNGSSSVSSSLQLYGLLENGAVFVLAHSQAAEEFTQRANYTHNGGVLNFNGDDAVALYRNSTAAWVDIFGVIGERPTGGAWVQNGISTLDQTLVRRPEVNAGINDNPVDFSTLGTQWIQYPINTYQYLGYHEFGSRNLQFLEQDLNVGNVLSYRFPDLQPDSQYYYRVRAENASGQSGNSDEIGVFTQSLAAPNVAASHIEANVGARTISLHWQPGNGSRRVVVMNTVNYFSTIAEGTDPVANSSYLGQGQQVIYNGSSQMIDDMPFDGVFVDNLQAETYYYFRIFEANGNGEQSLYFAGTATGNPAYFSTLPDAYSGYYSGVSGYGEELKQGLHQLLRDSHSTEYNYNQVWTQLFYTDEDPANPDNIIEIYTGWSVPKSHYGGGVTQWNREHTWSKSHGGFGETKPAGTDLHHLRPCDATVNSAKGNKDFDNGGTLHVDSSPYGSYSGNTGCYSASYTWEPRDEDKGDVARMLMYMAVRYEGTDTSYDLELVDYTNSSPQGQPLYGKLSTLLQWHLADPVDTREQSRNDRIFERQGNRNPFIDHPEFAQYLWTPVPLEPLGIGETEFTARWSLPIAGTAYYLQVSVDSLFNSFLPGYANYNVGTNASKSITGLEAGANYYYRLRNFLGEGYSMYSPYGRVTLLSPEPVPALLLIQEVDGFMQLEIQPVAGALSYRIFAADSPDGLFEEISDEGDFFEPNLWRTPVGERQRRFYRAYGIR